MKRPNLDYWLSVVLAREDGSTHWEGCEDDHRGCQLIKTIKYTKHLESRLAEAERERDELRYWFAIRRVDRNDDPTITCVLCGEDKCDQVFVTRADGETAWNGRHWECARKVRARDKKGPE